MMHENIMKKNELKTFEIKKNDQFSFFRGTCSVFCVIMGILWFKYFLGSHKLFVKDEKLPNTFRVLERIIKESILLNFRDILFILLYAIVLIYFKRHYTFIYRNIYFILKDIKFKQNYIFFFRVNNVLFTFA